MGWRPLGFQSYVKEHHIDHYKNVLKKIRYNLIDDQFSKRYFALKAKQNKGDKVFKRIVNALTSTKNIKLLPFQLNFVRKCLIPTLKQIYKNEWEKKLKQILKSHGIKNWFPEVLFISGRRMGKTLTLAMMVVVFAMFIESNHIHPLKIAVFSINRDASFRFIDECKSMLKCVRGKGNFKIKVTRGSITFTNIDNPNDVREIVAFCGKGDVR